MDTALYPPVVEKAGLHNHYTDLACQSIEPLDTLAAKSPNLAKWRSVAVDGAIVPSYVLIGPRIGRVPIRLGLFGGIRIFDLLSTISIAKLLVELDLAVFLEIFSYEPGQVECLLPQFGNGCRFEKPTLLRASECVKIGNGVACSVQ